MFLMMAEILRLAQVASSAIAAGSTHPDFWNFLAFHQSHVEWNGCSLHDMIQPSFSFLVGVALPFSIASRIARGQSTIQMTLHAFWRAVVLVLLGVFLRSLGSSQTNWTFEDTLTQIGLGYGFLFLLGLRSWRVQLAALLLILVGYWLSFAFYPQPDSQFDWSSTGVTADWSHHATSFAAHWNKNTNAAWAFDTWFMNLWPREQKFAYNGGGYSTLSFIPTLGTMLLGLLAGTLLRSDRKWLMKCGILLLTGFGCVALGWGLEAVGLCPIVKRIWTPAWVLYSGGLCFFALTLFYLVADVARARWVVYPLIVIGANSIVAYCMADAGLNGFFMKNLQTHFGTAWTQALGGAFQPMLLGAAVLLVDWLVLFWMYRRKIFVRI